MANFSVWIFDTKSEAQNHAQFQRSEGRETIGPTQLGSVDVTNRSSSNSPDDKYFKNFPDQWGVAVLG